MYQLIPDLKTSLLHEPHIWETIFSYQLTNPNPCTKAFGRIEEYLNNRNHGLVKELQWILQGRISFLCPSSPLLVPPACTQPPADAAHNYLSSPPCCPAATNTAKLSKVQGKPCSTRRREEPEGVDVSTCSLRDHRWQDRWVAAAWEGTWMADRSQRRWWKKESEGENDRAWDGREKGKKNRNPSHI